MNPESATIEQVKDQLGRRMKQYYEDALRLTVPRCAYFIVRVDGRAFHNFTRTLERPYCRPLADALDHAALLACQEMIGCRFAYGQSDEYSFLLSDLDSESAPLWFDGNVQKIVSVSASIFTAGFNHAFPSGRPAVFDARLMVIPQWSEVEKYFLWRQLDASANSLNMLVSHHYSHAELLGKTTAEKHELLHAKGANWAKEPAEFKRGRVVCRMGEQGAWGIDREIPIFNRAPDYLTGMLANNPAASPQTVAGTL